MNDNKGEISFTGIMIGLVTVGLFMSIIVYSIVTSGNTYDATGFNETVFSEKYVHLSAMEEKLNSTNSVLEENVDGNKFDVFGQWLNKGLSAWKSISSGIGFISDSTGLMGSMTKNAVSDLQLPQFWKNYVSAVIIVIIVIGLFLMNYLMKVKK